MDISNWQRKSSIAGRTGVAVPYRQAFNNELKTLVPSAKFDHNGSIWFYNQRDNDTVAALVEKYFVNTRRFRLEVEFDRDPDFSIDGCSLVFVGRDHWSWRFDDNSFDAKVGAVEIETGGSRNNPHLTGRCVIEVTMRADADIKPTPVSITAVDNAPAPHNPLANISTEDLLKELERRGIR